MIEKVFEEVVREARNGIVNLKDDVVATISFNVASESESSSIPNFYIKDYNNFYKLLKEYVFLAIPFYNLKLNPDDVKIVLTYLWSNITLEEMKDLESYVKKYIHFISDNSLINNGIKETSIGTLNYEVKSQSVVQETPYSFVSYFRKDNSVYYLPRISFGIMDNRCYIYAIQNKDSKNNIDSEFNLKVKDKFKTINSGVNKYRNVTPSFVVTLSLFVSFLQENNINNIVAVSPLPIRIKNREEIMQKKIDFKTMWGKVENPEVLKKEMINKRINDDFNSTVKFINTFNRLKVHFDNIFIDKIELSSGIILEVVDLITKCEFLKEITDRRDINGKISKYSSC